MVSSSSHSLSSLFYILCFLLSSDWIISNTYLLPHWFFLLLNQICCYWLLLHFSFHSLPSLAPEFLLSTYTHIHRKKSHITRNQVFLISLNCLCFLVVHRDSFKQLFWILCWENYRSPFLWGQLPENYWVPRICHVFDILHYSLHIWTSSYIL